MSREICLTEGFFILALIKIFISLGNILFAVEDRNRTMPSKYIPSDLREYEFIAIDKEIEIAPGVFFPAWTYNGQVPGPTIRATEGDRIRIRFRN